MNNWAGRHFDISNLLPQSALLNLCFGTCSVTIEGLSKVFCFPAGGSLGACGVALKGVLRAFLFPAGESSEACGAIMDGLLETCCPSSFPDMQALPIAMICFLWGFPAISSVASRPALSPSAPCNWRELKMIG